MAITLAQAKTTMTDKVDQLVIDEFRRESMLLDKLTFDDAVSSGTGGSTLTYGYGKYVQAVPLDRQQKDYSALDAPVLKASMSNWTLLSANRYARPVFEEMKNRLFKEPVIHADETRVNVINEPEKKTNGKAHKSQMWVYFSGKHAEKFMALFEYRRTRKGEDAAAFLGDYSGYVTCDGYDAYNSLKNAKRCGCFAHARRRFVNALPNDKTLIPTSEAAKAIAYINKLYELERSYENLELKSLFRIFLK